jgi:predicted transcriptional regulator
LNVPTDRPRITVTLDFEISNRLEALSEQTGLSKSHLALKAIQEMLQDDPNELRISLSVDVAQRLTKLADANFRSTSDEARLAIAKHLEQNG